PLDEETRAALRQFFLGSSAYVIDKESTAPAHEELAARWTAQLSLDDVIEAIAAGKDQEALTLAPQFGGRPSVLVGLLFRMMQTRRPALIRFTIDSIERDPSLTTHRFH